MEAHVKNYWQVSLTKTSIAESIHVLAQPDASLHTPPTEKEFEIGQALYNYREVAWLKFDQ